MGPRDNVDRPAKPIMDDDRSTMKASKSDTKYGRRRPELRPPAKPTTRPVRYDSRGVSGESAMLTTDLTIGTVAARKYGQY
jgi:hypothetical protein